MNFQRRLISLAAVLTFLLEISSAISLGIKGHNSGSGAVELLLATGILAKLLNIRSKGGEHRIVPMIHALFGRHRYASAPLYPEHGYSRSPNFQVSESLLEDDLLEQNSIPLPILGNHASSGLQHELLLNEESHSMEKANMFYALPQITPILSSGPIFSATGAHHILAPQDVQDILAARRARKLLAAQQAKKLLMAEQARRVLEARKYLAAQEAQSLITVQDPRSFIAESISHPEHYMASTSPQGTPRIIAASEEGHGEVIDNVPSSSKGESRQVMTEEEFRSLLAAQESRQFVPSDHMTHQLMTTAETVPLFRSEETGHIVSLRHHQNSFGNPAMIMNYRML